MWSSPVRYLNHVDEIQNINRTTSLLQKLKYLKHQLLLLEQTLGKSLQPDSLYQKQFITILQTEQKQLKVHVLEVPPNISNGQLIKIMKQ